jgi:hypothetical protein
MDLRILDLEADAEVDEEDAEEDEEKATLEKEEPDLANARWKFIFVAECE